MLILILRPASLANCLCHELDELGIAYYRFPTIAIEALPITRTDIKKIEQSDMAIFTSQNALKGLAGQRVSFPRTCIAVGHATQTALAGLGLKAATPVTPSSEGLLQMPALQHVAGATITLCAGIGGRDLLQETLISRGAKVYKVELYKRKIPEITPQYWMALMHAPISAVLGTSEESLLNLMSILGEHAPAWLQDKTLIVGSARIKAKFTGIDCKAMVIAKSVHQPDLVEAIKAWYDANQMSKL